jgi:hypothetical protein
MIPEVHACSGYLVITPKRAYRDNAGALGRGDLGPSRVIPSATTLGVLSHPDPVHQRIATVS